MTRYEITAIFDQVDVDHNGKINQHEWNDFYISYITHFENSDGEPRDGVLIEKEVETALEDITDFKKDVLDFTGREKYLYEIMETLTSRTQVTRGEAEISLNLYEYMFLRKVAIAWMQCSAQSGLMAKS